MNTPAKLQTAVQRAIPMTPGAQESLELASSSGGGGEKEAMEEEDTERGTERERKKEDAGWKTRDPNDWSEEDIAEAKRAWHEELQQEAARKE